MKSLGAKHAFVERPQGSCGPLGAGLAALLLAGSERDAVARGLALVLALRPEDFLGTAGQGDEARDFYAAVYAGQPLRVGLGPYSFDGWPRILMIAITALSTADGDPAGAIR